MISFPNAKINLGLNILNKREDGYHNIESCFYPIPWYDALEIMEAKKFAFHSYGLEIPGKEASNLCIKAYELLQTDFSLPPIEIHLLKAIPMGAGLGGGSADGAFTLKMLNELFELGISNEQQQVYALQLGSDCPFFIKNKPALATGRGEQLQTLSIDLHGYHLAIHNPDIHISTSEAYSGFVPAEPTVRIKEVLASPITDWKNQLTNDFEGSVFEGYPKIRLLKEEMYQAGALYASMTGSGSTVFGIFDKVPTNVSWKKLCSDV